MSRSQGMKYMEDAMKTMKPKDFTKDEIVKWVSSLSLSVRQFVSFFLSFFLTE